jgi:hypothetical protein
VCSEADAQNRAPPSSHNCQAAGDPPAGKSQWVGTGRTAVLCLPIPPVVTVRAAFTAHGGRLVGPFSSSSGDMDLRGEFVDFPTYPRLREG